MHAMDHIDILRNKLLALKEGIGQTLNKFLNSYDNDGVTGMMQNSQSSAVGFSRHCMTMSLTAFSMH